MYAEDVNYWQTSRTGSDAWLVKAKKEIVRAGGQVVGSVTVSDDLTGRAGFMLAFQIGSDRFKMTWPVLKPRRGSLRAARIQAVTALYHEVKAGLCKSEVLGQPVGVFGLSPIARWTGGFGDKRYGVS